MKKRLFFLSCLLFISSASAQALWQDIPVDATVAEVQALVPEAQTLPARPTANGGTVQLEIPAYELAGDTFKVSFVFKADRLQRITLLADAGSADKARALGQRLTTSLRARYGLERSTRSRGSTSSVTIDRQWSFRRTIVHLQVLDVRFVSLEYSAQMPVRNDRL